MQMPSQSIGFGILLLFLIIVILGVYFGPSFSEVTPAPQIQSQEGFEADGTASLPAAPYGQIAKTAPSMWKDGVREPTTRKRVLEMLENLRAFLTFEAASLEDTSDPAIQLPLNVLKGDLKRLESEALFLKRNPGITPMITMSQMDEMEANLDGLRIRARTITGGVDSVEAFESGGSQADACGPASLDEVKGLASRISQEVTRLSANGTKDPVMAARIANLKKIGDGVQDILNQVSSGDLVESEIPIYTCDITNFLNALGQGNESKGIPALFQSVGLSSLFPSGTDPETAKQVNMLLEKYGEKLMNGLSAGITLNFGIKYTGSGAAAANAGQSGSGVTYSSNLIVGESGSSAEETATAPSPAPVGADTSAAATAGEAPPQAGRGPATFDWKKRSKEICAAVRRRGLDPGDYGCMSPAIEVSDNYNWRGYARMVCTRLSASYEHGLPELVGCPGPSWPGWTTRQQTNPTYK